MSIKMKLKAFTLAEVLQTSKAKFAKHFCAIIFKLGAVKAFTLPKVSAFTLAEVLITLSIIGVVAALTIPSVISRNNEVETVTKVKKAYSTFSQAYNMAIAQNGGLNLNGNSDSGEGALSLANNFIPYLHIMKDSGSGNGCTAWVVLKGNMDYLKRTVSWDE